MTHHILGHILEVFPDPDKTGEYDHWQGGIVTFKVVHEGTWIGWMREALGFLEYIAWGYGITEEET